LNDGSEFQLVSLIHSVLFQDVKIEFDFPESKLNRLEKIFDLLSKNPLDYSFSSVIYVIWNIFCRLNISFLHSKYKQFQQMKSEMEIIFFKGEMKKNVKDVNVIKEKAELDVQKPLLQWNSFESVFN
jgi:hypothetical protein